MVKIPQHIHIVFRREEGVITANISKTIKNTGLTLAQFGILDVLYTKGQMKICNLLNIVLATSGNMTVILKNMESANLIYRKKDEVDKPAFLVRLKENRKNFLKKFFLIIEKN
ncbi:MarR family winged helix-turn-helix transcriptional regulator [Gemella sp. zg-1178]|uniref:MarR family winged helix-turn-helix transcriptional regulator n=1 Tax=Gemella sp. zg-1178 TaxID=2840372 RepID=UPI001C05B8E1|nr:MarR family transcriptional regulator [Gemella sp. zg-1178]MBU0278962.1 MarR family transcriptional regulator [Gemella sp. zg-1178]